MARIFSMDGKEGDASEADPDLIAELEALIEQVKANEIVGVSSLYFHSDGTCSRMYLGNTPNHSELAGCMLWATMKVFEDEADE